MRVPGEPLAQLRLLFCDNGHRGDEPSGVGVIGIGEDLLGRIEFDQLSSLEDGDAFGDVRTTDKVVGDEDVGQPPRGAQIVQQLSAPVPGRARRAPKWARPARPDRTGMRAPGQSPHAGVGRPTGRPASGSGSRRGRGGPTSSSSSPTRCQRCGFSPMYGRRGQAAGSTDRPSRIERRHRVLLHQLDGLRGVPARAWPAAGRARYLDVALGRAVDAQNHVGEACSCRSPIPPTIARHSPSRTSKDTESTARSLPEGVWKSLETASSARRGVLMRPPSGSPQAVMDDRACAK